MYITSRRRTVRLGSLQGLCDRFLIRNQGSSSHTGETVQPRAPLVFLLYGTRSICERLACYPEIRLFCGQYNFNNLAKLPGPLKWSIAIGHNQEQDTVQCTYCVYNKTQFNLKSKFFTGWLKNLVVCSGTMCQATMLTTNTTVSLT